MAEFRVIVDSIWTKPDNFKILLKFDTSMTEDDEFEDAQETIVDEDMDEEDDEEDDDE